MESAEDVRAHLNRLHEAVWQLAAVAVALRGAPDTSAELRHAAEEVVGAAVGGFDEAAGGDPANRIQDLLERAGDDPSKVASQAAAPILQAGALLSGARHWSAQDDEALLAQGRASAQGAELFKQFAVPSMPGLEQLLTGPSPVMLDVGVGVAAMAVAWCQAWPGLRIVGLDVFDRALALAEHTVTDAGLGDRIELRHLDVADLDEEGAFSLAWLPAPFIPPPAMEAGLARIAAALAPGGWVVVGHGRFGEDALSSALTRFQTVAFGGTPLDDDEAEEFLEHAGFVDVGTLPTPPGAPALTVGRRPPAH
jgi:hypothetical protein